MGQSHTVADGETLASIAEKYGFRSWQTIYEHADNASLRQKRPNPMVLAAGDTVAIPDKRVKEVVCETNRRHTFKLKPLLVQIRLRLTNPEGAPYAEKRYTLVVDGKSYEGTTSSDGLVEQSVPPSAKKGELTLWRSDAPDDQVTWQLSLGTLAPIDTNKGVKARLVNLGYEAGTIDDNMDDEKAKEAIKAFQADHGMEVKDGALDEATRKAIDDAYGNV